MLPCPHAVPYSQWNPSSPTPQVFGAEWARSRLIPEVLNTHTNPNYLFRMTSLSTITALATTVGNDLLLDTMLPIVLQMGTDPVPNIRFNVAKTLQLLLPLLDATFTQQRVKPCLQSLLEDADQDVRFFAGQALAAVG